jgi:hypothetical protein
VDRATVGSRKDSFSSIRPPNGCDKGEPIDSSFELADDLSSDTCAICRHEIGRCKRHVYLPTAGTSSAS